MKRITIIDDGSSMFNHGGNILCNPVNCVGVMDGGLALDFKERYPDMFNDYKDMCVKGVIKPGVIHTYPVGEKEVVFNVPTKIDFKFPSTLDIVRRSLVGLYLSLITIRPYLSGGIVCIPALGCGLGGLDWKEVLPLIGDTITKQGLEEYTFKIFKPQN